MAQGKQPPLFEIHYIPPEGNALISIWPAKSKPVSGSTVDYTTCFRRGDKGQCANLLLGMSLVDYALTGPVEREPGTLHCTTFLVHNGASSSILGPRQQTARGQVS